MRLAGLALAWLLGLVLAQQQKVLPNPIVSGLVAAMAVGLLALVWVCGRRIRPRIEQANHRSNSAIGRFVHHWRPWCLRILVWCAIGLLGFVWAGSIARWRLADAIPPELDNRDAISEFVITGLPVESGSGLSLQVRVPILIESGPQAMLGREVLLSWHGACRADCTYVLAPGQRWRARLNWRLPHGTLNFYGPDVQQRLFAKGVLGLARMRGTATFLGESDALSFQGMLAAIRHKVAQRMRGALKGRPLAGVLIALALGDQQSITQSQWKWFARAGISHLVAISGTHVALVASLAGLCLGGVFGRLRWRGESLLQSFAMQPVFALTGLLAALGYCLLAGWGIAARRTFFTLTGASLALWCRWPLRAFDGLAIALLAVTVADPSSVLSPGFWLSFGAVAALLGVAFSKPQLSEKTQAETLWWRWYRGFWGLLKLQCVLTLASVPVIAWLFQEVSVVSILTNLWAIPWVGLLLTPAALFLAICAGLGLPDLWLMWLATAVHALAWVALVPTQVLSELRFATFEVAQAPIWLMVLGLAGVILAMTTPPGLRRGFAWLLMLPQLFWHEPGPKEGAWRLVAFDIGQGSAVLIQTREHQVLYDTGWRHGQSDAVERVVLPQLRAMGIRHLNDVVISHPDLDHIGGLETLLKTREVERLWGSGLVPMNYRACEAGQSWAYDGVTFRMVAPTGSCAHRVLTGVERNRCSCVLLVQGHWHSVLLPGDIDTPVENDIVVGKGLKAHRGRRRKSKHKTTVQKIQAWPYGEIDVVMMAHHGSNSSSGPAWIKTLSPAHAIAQAGHHNRFGHPHPKVLQRWQGQNTRTWVTSHDGAIEVQSDSQGLQVQSARVCRERYWHIKP